MPSMNDEVLIIGGGFAGLTAGVALAGAGRRVRLLEQKPYLGGRARSFVDSVTGSVVDNGQHIIMGCFHKTLEFLRTIGTADCIQFQSALRLHFLESNGRHSSFECPGLRPPWHLLAGVVRSGSFRWGEKWDVLRLGQACSNSHGSGAAPEWLTVETWLKRFGQADHLRRNFWDLLCVAVMNEDPEAASADLFRRALKLALFGLPEDSRVGIANRGLSDCYTEAARDYIVARGGRVELGRDVTRLNISGSACRGVQLMGGERIEARTVLSAAPWHELARLLTGDILRSEPALANALTLRPSPIVSINLWFDRPVTDLDFAALRGTTIQWLFNKGKIFGSGKHYISVVISGAHEEAGRTKDELVDMAVRELAGLLPSTRDARLIHSLVVKERFATFSPVCGVDRARPVARTPIRGLFLAGDWTATGLPATIESAVQSGYTAAEAILKA